MGVYDEQEYPWLKTEKTYLQEAIHNNKVVIGICLGAQLIAAVLGAEVYPNSHKQIGWFVVLKKPQSHNTSIGKILPESFMAFHWHGDTFAIPDGAVHLTESRACKNQAFVYGKRVIALQFHLESTESSVESLIQHCGNELTSALYIQTEDQIRGGYRNILPSNALIASLMNHMIIKDVL